MLTGNDIDATMLPPSAPAVRQMDERPGWRRLYADTSPSCMCAISSVIPSEAIQFRVRSWIASSLRFSQ
jgi:hypothetical protein